MYPFDVHGFVSSDNSEGDLVADLAAVGVVELGWERSRLLVVLLGIGELLQKLAQILDAPVEGDSVVLTGVGGFEECPDVFLGIGDLLADGELLDLAESSAEFSVLLADSLGVFAFVFIGGSWADLEGL